MRVYVASVHWDYEGGRVLGVRESPQEAQKVCEKYAQEYDYERVEWHDPDADGDLVGFTKPSSSTSFEVTQFDTQEGDRV